MEFPYRAYWACCFLCPALGVIFFLVFCTSIPGWIKRIREFNTSIPKVVFEMVVATLIACFFLCGGVCCLGKGGIHLLYERQADAVTVYGQIEDCEGVGRIFIPISASRLDYEPGDTAGVRLTISGIDMMSVCTAEMEQRYTPGEYVKVVYLPKSGYILSISLCTEDG